MRKLKFIMGCVLVFAVAELGMWKGSELIQALDGKVMDYWEKPIESSAPEEEEAMDEYLKEGCPEELLELLENNPETEEFVKDYPNREKWDKEVKLTKDEKGSQAPLFLQWDRRWGYSLYGDKMMAINGCGPTCLSMVLVGLKGDADMNPKAVAQYSASAGHLTEDSGTQWSLMTEGARALGLEAEELSLDEDKINQALDTGHQVICSMRPGDFTTTGHFILIYGRKDGKLLIHDPNSKERSKKKWKYEDIQGQIKNLWKYSA